MRNVKTHGHTRAGPDGKPRRSPTYCSYHSMIARCTQPSNAGFAHYKKLGITICDRWRYGDGERSGFECFLADMGERPEGTTLDRYPNQTGDYGPDNCRWATRREQANNRSTNRLFKYQGELLPYHEIARRSGIPVERLRHRLLRAGWSIEEALCPDRVPGRRPYETMMDIAKRAGIEYRVFAERIRAGWAIEDAIAKPIRGR